MKQEKSPNNENNELVGDIVETLKELVNDQNKRDVDARKHYLFLVKADFDLAFDRGVSLIFKTGSLPIIPRVASDATGGRSRIDLGEIVASEGIFDLSQCREFTEKYSEIPTLFVGDGQVFVKVEDMARIIKGDGSVEVKK